jgi:glycosyltransferase involved in cell wall biosynthesis
MGRIERMRVGIDASNIRAGGGLTHLVEVLSSLNPGEHGIERVLVWGGRATLDRLPEQPWLIRSHQPALDRSPLHRIVWRRTKLDDLLLRNECDVLFAPGGVYSGSFRPFVTMSQNLLPFDRAERARFGLSLTRLRYHVLEHLQAATFRHAAGVILLTEEAKRVTLAVTGNLAARTTVIPHGIAAGFLNQPRTARAIERCTADDPFRILYVSIINLYKHQWHVADAVCRLRRSGLPVRLDLVGRAYPSALRKLRGTLAALDPQGDCVRYLGPIPYEQLGTTYTDADAFVFASTCETFGMIVLEAMASGLPIACSQRSAMPEILGEAGVYFDPEDAADLERCLRALVTDVALRQDLAQKAFTRAQTCSWERCARETFAFITDVAESRSTTTRV